MKSILRLGVAGGIFYLPFLALFYDDLFWGTRGIIRVNSNQHFTPLIAATSFVKFQFKHYSLVNLLLLPALLCLRRERALLIMTLALVLPNLYVISKLESEDNVFILTLDLVFVCWFMIGWQELRRRSVAWLAAACLFAQIVVFVIAEQSLFRPANSDYGHHMREVMRIVHAEEGAVLVADWARRVDYVYYNTVVAHYPIEQGPWFEQTVDLTSTESRLESLLSNEGPIFVVESYRPSGYSQLYLSEQSLAARFEGNSTRRQVERVLGYSCELNLPGYAPLYRCR